jgi:hypothetical protein
MQQLGIDVTLRHADDGFTVRLRHLPGIFRAGRHGAVTQVAGRLRTLKH